MRSRGLETFLHMAAAKQDFAARGGLACLNGDPPIPR